MSDLEERMSIIEEKLNSLTKDNKKSKKNKMGDESKPRPTRQPTAYNNFMSTFIKEQKEKLGSEFNHKVAFGEGAQAWKAQKS